MDEGRRAVQEAIATYRAGGRPLADESVAWITVVLAHLAVRDDAWSRMDPGFRTAHLRLWTDIVRRATPAYLPAPASLLAFTAWQSGEGALANIAIDRALAADPGYSLAQLLRDIMDAGVPPSAARVPMTPDRYFQIGSISKSFIALTVLSLADQGKIDLERDDAGRLTARLRLPLLG